ncbi:hypothetical protein HDN1F_05970 [gamma proteobacterium HdN1]|nr:hypothetical protein HDN1F_05970 [gamma proteobacterium HdN1]
MSSGLEKRFTLLFTRAREHFENPTSQHRQIAVGFLWVSLFVFVGKLAGAAKEMVIAWRYGVSQTPVCQPKPAPPIFEIIYISGRLGDDHAKT